MKKVSVGGVVFGAAPDEDLSARPPLLIASLTGTDAESLAAAAAVCSGVDLVEWRVDYLRGFAQVPQAAQRLAQAAAHPIIATFRSSAEGGAAAADFFPNGRGYVDVIAALLAEGHAGAVDVEVCASESARAVDLAAQAGVPVIGSFHDFSASPGSVSGVLADLRRAQDAGAQILKVAYTPRQAADTLVLLESSLHAAEQLCAPAIVIGMGPLGRLTRVVGPAFGQWASFVAGANVKAMEPTMSSAILDENPTAIPSAPGQLTAAQISALY